ncbi:MAG: GWxTD domain-containing protein [Candidatus Aminicenantes bacterium]|nr:GWxTD domain-containing protein [Candidatus Aminicenantes bacterium]
MRTKRSRRLALSLVLLFLGAAGAAPGRCAAPQGPPAREPLSEASRQWLDEVVPYIITPAEKEVFLRLGTEKERGEFIEGFWKKRDPDPVTPENEAKLEYYRRIAQTNKLFSTSGISGWRTDRGRIYILLGPPKEVQRDFGSQGSGLSAFTGPKETWQYWDLPNPKLPYNMEFVFVDRFGTGSYVLDQSFRADRGRNALLDAASVTFQFDALENLSEALKNPFENLGNLKGVITAEVDYDLVPFRWDVFAFKGTPKNDFLPMLVEVPYASIPVKKGEGADLISLNLTVNVSDALGRIVFGTSRDVNFRRTAAETASSGDRSLDLQASLFLEPAVYTFHLRVLDNYSGKMGTSHREVRVPELDSGELALSDLVLSPTPIEELRPAGGKAGAGPLPGISLAGTSSDIGSGDELNLYLEVYGLSLDPATGLGRFAAEYFLMQDGKTLSRIPASQTPPAPERDCRLRSSFRLKDLKPGDYVLRAKITDGVSGSTAWKERPFHVSE